MSAEGSSGQRSTRSYMTDQLGRLGMRSAQILLIITLASVVVFALVQLKLVVIPVLIALILAAALWPVISSLRRRNVPAVLAAWITLLTGVLAFGGTVALIARAVQNQWNELAVAASDGLDQLQAYLARGQIPIGVEQTKAARDAIVGYVTSSQFRSGAISGVSAATEVIAGALLMVVILFFFLKDGDRIWDFFLGPLKGERLERAQRIGQTAPQVLGGYVRGTAIIALVDAVAIGIGLVILQVPLALPLAVVVFLGAFVPLIGATLAGLLAALVALVANGPVAALIVVIIVIAVNQIEGDLLQPVVMAQSLKLHPLVILVALTAGTVLGGITGAVLSVPTTAVAWAIVKVWNGLDDSTPTEARTPLKGPLRKRFLRHKTRS
ncbi:MAG TPA: AI-2E family transporter [Dermatophilaceae bacterium]|nr:AI-2E family transporter [Dermatophilaceae bacterium]